MKKKLIMPLSKLEAVKQKYPRVAKQLDDLFAYLSAQQQNGITDFLPKLTAVKLNTSEAVALGLLRVFEDAGILSHEYHILCKRTGALIAALPSLSNIADSYECNFCGDEHGIDDLKVELVFKPSHLGGSIENAA
jgi:hypothetical protein